MKSNFEDLIYIYILYVIWGVVMRREDIKFEISSINVEVDITVKNVNVYG